MSINTQSPSRKAGGSSRSNQGSKARRASSAAPTRTANGSRSARPAARADQSSVSRDANRPQAQNPVKFESWSGGLLKSGASGGQVATMQKALNEKTGGNLAVDGKFGKDTQAALEKFQRSNQLDPDGKAGDKTREALMGQAGAPRQPTQAGSNGETPNAAPAAKVAGPAKVDGQPKSGFGEKLARDARRIAESGVAGSGRNCKRGVRMAFEKNGMGLSGVSAYMAADQLAKNKNFSEAKGLSRQDLKELPPGATVVWNRGKGRPHGHISIAQGNGREASDVMRNQIVNYPTSYRVFMPN